MKTRIFVLLTLLASLVVFPGLASGKALETAATSAEGNLLAFVEKQFDMELWSGYDIAVSSDGRNVYVACAGGSVVAFGRDPITGRLSYIETEQDGVGGVDGLSGAWGIALDPDDENVYVVGSYDSAIAVFDRNPTTGALEYREVHKQGDSIAGGGTIDGLSWASAVTVSADGLYVYVASRASDAVATFDRNSITGELDYKGAIFDTDSGVDGLDGATSIALGPGGDHVYVASEDDSAVTVLEREPSGLLSFVEAIKDGVGAGGLGGAGGVAVSSDGKHVYVTGYDDDAVVIFDRNSSSGELDYNETVWNIDPLVEGLDGALAITLSSDGNHVYVVGQVDDAVAVFRRDAADGSLEYKGRVQGWWGSGSGLYGISAVGISPDGGHVYVADVDSTASFSRNAGSGALTLLQMQTSANDLDGAVGIATSPDGKHVYVTGYLDDAVTKFNRDPATGKLTWPSAYSGSELDGAVGVALDTEGENVYVASCDEGAVVTFERDASSGGLSRTQTLALSGLGCARSIAVSPGDEHVYVASSGDDTVLIFDRSAVDGKLSYLGTVEDDTFGVDGLDGAYSVIVSPGGENVYVASYYDDAVAHFDRNADGSLSYQSDDLWKDGTGLALYLDGANGLAISPDGKFVYVASRVDDSVTVFRRLSVSGNLQFVNAYRDGVGGVDGLNGARAVAVSPDGNQVYVASQNDHALAVFDRDETFGLLQFVGVYKDGQSGVDGLNTANGVAVSPDNGHVYVTGYGDDAVAVFARWRVYLPLVLR